MILGRKKTHILFTHIFDAYVRIQKKSCMHKHIWKENNTIATGYKSISIFL